MTALLKRNGDPEATDEFILPESFKKATAELKAEKETINKELEEAKSEPVVRKVDESTKMFNLRQVQMEEKINQLEQKKIKAEKELHVLLGMKNSKLHEDLRKVATVLLTETKKIAPLEKDIETSVAKIINLKNEIQQFFESNLEEKKKNSGHIEDQTREVHQLGVLVRESMMVLEKDLHQLVLDIEKLSMEKIDIHSSLGKVKEELFEKETAVRLLDQRRSELHQIESSIHSYHEQLAEMKEFMARFHSLQEQMPELKKRQDEYSIQIQMKNQQLMELEGKLSRQEMVLKHTEDQVMAKKAMISLVEKEALDGHKSIESLRKVEFEVKQDIQHEQLKLEKTKTELAHFQAMRGAALKLHDDSFDFYKMKKEVYARELSLLEEAHHSKLAQLDAEFEARKVKWESEFRVYCDEKQSELMSKLESMDHDDLEAIKKKKNEFSLGIVDILKHQVTKEGFTSVEQKTMDAKKELEHYFDSFFGSTNRWKWW